MTEMVVDSRETNSGIPRLLQAAGVQYRMEELAAGDYRIGDLLIERKGGPDLSASLLDGRLFGQAEALAAAAPRPVLLLEGDPHTNANLHPDALPGAISALSIFWHLQVISTRNKEDTARLLARMFHHTVHGLGYEVPLRVGKPSATSAVDGGLAQYLVEGLPGVGPEMARKLLLHFGSARGVFTASAADLLNCKGVGPKTAEKIAQALDHSPRAYRLTKGRPQGSAG